MGRQPCCDRVGLKKGPWTIEEDHKLVNFIINNGIHCWRSVPKLAGLLRCGKSCRLRWINYLRPDLKRGALSEAEEDQIIQLHARLGNRWSKIASHFPGRTDNEIKNIWNTKIKKKLKLVGLDHVTHQPIEQKEKEVKKDENNLFDKISGETQGMENEIEKYMTKPVEDIEYNTTTPLANSSTPRQSEVLEITDFLDDYEMLLMNDATTNSASSFSQNPSISMGESSSSSTSKEDSIQQWVESVDSILSWDYFDKLEDGFFPSLDNSLWL